MKLEYETLLNELISLSNDEFKNFSKKIVNCSINVIGVKTPLIKELVKKYYALSTDIDSIPYHKNFETDLFIGLYKMKSLKTNQEKYDFIYNFLLESDNWAIVDQISSAFKNKNETEVFNNALRFLSSNGEYNRRFGYLHILTNMSKQERAVDFMFEHIMHDTYYVMMSEAWLLSVLYIYFPKRIEELLFSTNTPKFIVNKSISKICDSRRVDENYKKSLKVHRIK